MKRCQAAVLTGAGVLALSTTPGWAQTSEAQGNPSAEPPLEELIVTARRKDERLQDVPTTVNVVTSDVLEKLSIRDFRDIQTIVPGLTLAGTSTTANASVRGVAFNQQASGSNGTIDFYLNDSPLPGMNLFQTMFDIGQVELLRGPQGTLRGRAAPSGSMTVTTRRPDLSEFGGYINTTATDQNGVNLHGALNIPLVDDMLAVRIAALHDETEGNGIASVNNSLDPSQRTKAGRATVRFEPTDNLSFIATYQKLERSDRNFTQVESLSVVNPAAPASPIFVTAADRHAVQDTPGTLEFDTDILNLQASWAFAGQKLNYVGSINETTSKTQSIDDTGDFFGPGTPAFLQGYGNYNETDLESKAHELRLSSEERLFGFMDYIIGGFYQDMESPTTSLRPSPIIILPPAPGNPGSIAISRTLRSNETQERSLFGNLIFQLGSDTEISAGARYIEYTADGGVISNGVPIAAAAQSDDFDTMIYSGSIKHDISDEFMAYAIVGTSWRPGITVIGDFSIAPSPLERSFTVLPPEESTSYEIGFKTSLFDGRMGLNLAIFQQEFANYPWRTPTGVYYVDTVASGATTFERVIPFNFVAPVPVDVYGVEVEWSFAATDNWDIGTNASYAKGEIQDGVVPCNDYFPRDGIPDQAGSVPTVAQIRAATGGGTISGCEVDYRASQSPLWSASLQSEYRFPVSTRFGAYVRGQASLYGDSLNDPTNVIDDVDGYGLLNLYLGLRGADGDWEVFVYGKNIAETERVLNRSTNPLSVSYRMGSTATTGVSTYRSVSVNDPRELGISFRYAFGSR